MRAWTAAKAAKVVRAVRVVEVARVAVVPPEAAAVPVVVEAAVATQLRAATMRHPTAA